MTATFALAGEFIELYKLLKVEGIASTGGEAKAMIAAGAVTVNGKTELRKRNKIQIGDTVTVSENTIAVIAEGGPA